MMKPLSAVTTLTVLTGLLTTVAMAADSEQSSTTDQSKSNAEVAVEAYEKADAKPVENWFGCPPVVEGDGSAQEQAAVKENCEPVTDPTTNSTSQ